MSHSLIWLPSVLINAGLKVAMAEGWEDRGRGDVREIQGVICHHTGTNVLGSNMPTLHTLIHGRSDLLNFVLGIKNTPCLGAENMDKNR